MILLLDEVDKNLLLVTNKCLKIFSHSNGVLLKVVKGIFENIDIRYAYMIHIRKLLMLANEEGNLKVYSTKDYSLLQ